MSDKLPHLRIQGPSEEIKYTSTGVPVDKPLLPHKNRRTHGEYIQSKLNDAWIETEKEYAAFHLERNGMYLEFQSSPGFELAVKSLEDLRQGIRLCNVREGVPDDTEMEAKTITFATVYIPNDKRNIFFNKVESYLNPEDDSESGNPKNANLINSINELRKALLIESFWLDDPSLIPDEEPCWCEVWLRGDTDEIITVFEELLKENNIKNKEGHIKFPERSVKLVHVNQSQLEDLTRSSDDIAEYRRAKNTADFFISESPGGQAEWVKDLLKRLNIEKQSKVSICILDTGVNNGHPLITPMLRDDNCLTCETAWGTHDHNKHGTLMAGLCGYGNLQSRFESIETVNIDHQLESVKILPPEGENDPELWGQITSRAISFAEIQAPDQKRVICMAVAAEDTRDRGRPSSWSGEIDQITSGVGDSDKRLILISAGNLNSFNIKHNYPDEQILESIHDPAQSWNAITVGAYTQLTTITDPELSDYQPLASVNELSPFSTTSMTWEDKWPIKPEVVFEGGNVAIDSTGFVTECDDCNLLSIYYKPHEKLLEGFNMTSAATALAANFAAQLLVQYPDYWPETIRALMVHSATWPDSLKKQFIENDNKTELKKVLRACGYGVPDLNNALYCASNSLTLIVEKEIQPFEKVGSEYKTKDMHLYELPWPKEELLKLEESEVEMRVTLSYFIEPGPGEIGWKDRYRYASHALRFDLNSPTESKDEFIRRINIASRDEDNGKPETKSSSEYWVIGQNRDKGSIHSDIWKGTASDLAASNLIAIVPKIGWWRERHNQHKYNNKTRYSLIVSIKTDNENIDIYNPVRTQIKQSIPVTDISVL